MCWRRLWIQAAAAACCCLSAVMAITFSVIDELRSYDGTNNNLEHFEWGAIQTPRIRNFPSAVYEYDSESPHQQRLPSARRVMEELFRKARPQKDKTVSHLLLEFGHFIVQDLLGSTKNATEHMPIPCDGTLTDYVFCPVTGRHQMGAGTIPFLRQTHTMITVDDDDDMTIVYPNGTRSTSAGTRQQIRSTINGMTSFLDLSNLYGLSVESSLKMRHTRGRFIVSPYTNLPPEDDSILPEGMKSGMNTSPGAFCFYVLFMRYHNLVADRFVHIHGMSDSEIFEAARRETIAVYQNLVEESYIPTLLGSGKLDPYQGYQPSVDPSMDEFFSAVSFRYAHTNFGQVIRVVDANYQPTPEDPLFLREVFKQNVPTLVRNLGGIEPFLRGLTITPAKAMDASFVDDLNLWSEATSVLDVQRGRDVGIPPYNDVRESMGLPRIQSFEELVSWNNDTVVLDALRTLYHDDIDLLDAYVGAILEPPQIPQLDQMGPVLTLSLKDQFSRLRDGDRFWYKNIYSKDEYEAFPGLSELVHLVCPDGMELFPSDPFLLVQPGVDPAQQQDGCAAEGNSNNQLTFLGGDFVVQWQLNDQVDDTVEEAVNSTIDVTLTVMQEMEGPGYVGIGWGSRQMKDSTIWFCTVDFERLQATGGLVEQCPSPEDAETTAQQPDDVISCCVAPAEKHQVPKCAEPGDNLNYYTLEVVDWCLSQEQSSVTIRAVTCPEEIAASGNSTTTNSNSDGCFALESTPDGKMDIIVGYNPISSSRPHGYQRRTAAQIDLRAGLMTQGSSEAPTGVADVGLIATHGAFMLIGWVILAPMGVFVVRYMKTKSWRLVAHISIMVSVIALMIPLLVGVLATVGETDKTQDHSLIGLILVGISFLMAATGRFRYIKWQGQKIGKITDFVTRAIHQAGGITFIVLAWWNCYTGLVRIGPEEASTAELAVIGSRPMGYDVGIFGFIKQYLYGPWIAFLVLVFVIAEVRKQCSGSAQKKMEDRGSLWDDDGADLDTMTLQTFLDATRLGNSLCIIDGRVLDITDFASSHPGGPEMLRYVRGSDITEEFLGKRDVDGIRHLHSHAALQLMNTLVVAKLVTDTDDKKSPRGRTGLLPLMKSKISDLHLSSVLSLPSRAALTFRRAKVIDVQYLAPSFLAQDQKKPVVLLRLSMARDGEADKEDRVTKLPGCSFRFRGIDKKGIVFEREYTAVRIVKQTSKHCGSRQQQYMSLANMESESGGTTPSTMFLPRIGNIFEGETDEECYDFVITLIPGGQMSNFLLGLKTGKLLLAQGPKVSPPVVSLFSDPKWNSVVFLAGGTGIAPMLQVIDFYLEKKHRDEIPFMFLIWVIRSPYHSFHDTLGLNCRVKASAGRLKLITIFSSVGEDTTSASSSDKNPLNDRSSNHTKGGGREDWSRRTDRVRSPKPGRPAWTRASQTEWGSQHEHQGSATPRGGTFSKYFRRKRRAKVRNLIARAQAATDHSETLAACTDDSGHEHVFDCDFWTQPVRSMSRAVDRLLVDGLLSSAQAYGANVALHRSTSLRFVAREVSSLTLPIEHANDKVSSASEDSWDDNRGSSTHTKGNGVKSLNGTTTPTAAESEEFEDEEEADVMVDPPTALKFERMLVAVSGSPTFESKLTSMLTGIGLPKQQMVTFGISTQQV